MLREVARRLLGVDEDTIAALRPEASLKRERAAWKLGATYFMQRVQAAPMPPGAHEGRGPDMSPRAAAALRAVLAEVGGTPPPEAYPIGEPM